MKERMFIYFSIFIMFILGFLISNAVSAQSPPLPAGLEKYKQTLLHEDVRSLLPGFLNVFNEAGSPKDIEPRHIGVFLGQPRFLRSIFPGIDDQFIALLYLNDDFRTLFGDEQFYNVLKSSTEINKLLKWYKAQPLPPPDDKILNIVSGNGQSGEVGKPLARPFVVEVLGQDGEPLQGTAVTFTVTAGNGQLSPTTPQTTNAQGQAQTTLTLGPQARTHSVTARAAGITQTQTFTATADVSEEPPTPTTLNIVSESNNQSGEVGKPLAHPFVVEVKGGNEFLGGVYVTFRVTAGGGNLWGKKEQTITTNEDGKAGITLTLGPEKGVNRVIASVVGTRLQKTFIAAATIAEMPLPPPVVYWIEDGAIFRYDWRSKQPLVLPEDWTATSLAVDTAGDKLYWTARKTDEQKGSIWSANLINGKNRRMLREINAVPNGIVLGVNGWLYWTNDRGKIQSINVNGKDFEGDFITGLGTPYHIALSLDGDEDTGSGTLYWTARDAKTDSDSWSIWCQRIGAGNSPTKKDLLTGLRELRGIAVDRNKLYWTEKVSDNQGKISCAYKNGSGDKTFSYVPGSAPLGLAVDEIGRRLYWTDNSGSIQSLNLDKPKEIVFEGSTDGSVVEAVAIALGRSAGGSVPASPTAPSTIAEHSVESALLANYPNPFNPETWIPYQLSAAADVSVSIYSVNGHLVRRLDLGHQSAGVYQRRSRAAYWDGRNAFGERVASGLYFYTLTAGDFTATRKMLIRK